MFAEQGRGRTYRMIAIDLDGTLLSPLGRVSERAKAAVHRALDAGLLVCFATGRNFTESRQVLEDVAHHDTAVFVGGAMVIDTKQRMTLHRTAVEPQLAAEVCELLESFGHAALALQDDVVAGFDYLVTGEIPLNAATVQWMKLTCARVQVVPRLGRHRHEHTIRVGIVAAREQMRDVERALQERFGERIFMQAIGVPSAGVDVLEIFDPSVNKWEGILHVARRHGIGPEQIIAIGDDVNDLHMIRNAGLGVAMGNARPEVQSVARRVIGTNQEDGLAKFLEELLETSAVQPLEEDDYRKGEGA
jgi:Cof subfamily protein (haloacid dehalogenase superfamily)